RVYSTATFYTMFHLEPVGEYHVQVCRTLSCWLRGAEAIERCLEKRLGIKVGETTPDGLFTLDTAECLASCNTAPVMQINERYYENLTEEKAVAIIDELARKGSKKKQTG
ncbi:MAG: NAD(P)H-dependent oxidoreductase subunit E, partial [Deltaproteobacteria bacterium]